MSVHATLLARQPVLRGPLVVEMRFLGTVSVNHSHFLNGHRKPEVIDWADELATKVLLARRALGWRDITGATVTCDVWWPNDRRRDSHNWAKQSLDAIARGLGIDDRHLRWADGARDIDKAKPRFRFSIVRDAP